MITINLLPAELKRVRKAVTARPFIPIVLLLVGLFMLLTIFFYVDYIIVKSSYNTVHKEWAKINPRMPELKALETRVDVELREKKEFLEKYVLNTDSATTMLQAVSEHLPRQGWLTELKFGREGDGGRLVLKGVVFSMPDKTGIEQIEEYIGQLKEQLPEGDVILTTAKQAEDQGAGMSFAATFVWGSEV